MVISLSTATRLPQPGFGQRFEWAIESNSSEELEALRAENPQRYAQLVAEHDARRREARVAAQLRERHETERASHTRRHNLQLGSVRVTDEMWDAIVDGTLGENESTRTVNAWWSSRKTPWLIISGPRGCGKSVATAACIAANGGSWLDANEIGRAFCGWNAAAQDSRASMKMTPLLVIDEVCGELDAARVSAALLELLSCRTSTRRWPVIITTNDTAAGFAERFRNDRLRSKLSELGSWVQVDGPDLRPRHLRVLRPSEPS